MSHDMSIKKNLIYVLILGGVFAGGYALGGGNSGGEKVQDHSVANLAPPRLEQAAPILDEAAIKKVVEAYIVENPQVIMRSVDDYQRNGATRNIVAQVPPFRERLENSQNMPHIGSPDAPIKIVEFFDYQCPYCKSSYSVLQRILKEDSSVVLLPKQLPILGGGREDDMSRYAAKAALAAHKQEKFADFHEALMESSGKLSIEKILSVAAMVGLDVELLKKDIDSPEVDRELSETFAIAEETGFLQVGTPSYLIGDQVMVGASEQSYERLRTMIEDARRIKTAQN